MELKNVDARLPPLSAALAIEVAGLEVKRDQFGMKWCAAHGVGAIRKLMGKPPLFFAPALSSISLMTTEEALKAASAIARDQSSVLLNQLCGKCRHAKCALKIW